MIIPCIVSLIGSYFIGSISFGFLIAKYVKGVDIRKIGSGNPGATNVSRAIGKSYGIAVYVLDMLKGFLPVFAADRLLGGPDNGLLPVLSAIGVICGHTFPIFLGFKGGKAAATGSGVLLWLATIPILIALTVWVITVAITRYVSLGSITSAITVVVCIIVLGKDPFGQGLYLTLFSLFLTTLLIIRHKSNIKRLLNGTEGKIGASKRE